MSQIKCPKCGTRNPENAQICQECGTSLLGQIENCLDVTNQDTTCENSDKQSSNKVLVYSIMIIVVLIVIITLILSFAPTPYWG